MINREATQLEDAVYGSGMTLAPASLSALPPRLRYSIPANLRLAVHSVKGPLRMVKRIEYPNRKGRITQAKVRIEYEPSIPWAQTGEPRLEFGGIPSDRAAMRYAPSRGSCLLEFVSLATVPPDKLPGSVLRFAQKWGVLRLCHHRKPERHRRVSSQIGDLCGGPPRYGGPFSPPVFSEPIEAWGRYSRQLRAILLVAANLRKGEHGNSQDWQTIEQGEPKGLSQNEREHWGLGNLLQLRGQTCLREERLRLSFDLWNWLIYGDVHVFPRWAGSSLETRLSYHGLTGRLAVEMASMLTHTVYRCKGCGEPFGVELEGRGRSRNKGAWCGSAECARIKNREASHRYYLNLSRSKQRKKSLE